MACCSNGAPVNPEDKKRHQQIEQLLREDKKKNTKIKLLLLGAGESGKSTIAKQMKIIHLQGYQSDEERKRFCPFVFRNIFDNITALVEACEAFDKKQKTGEETGKWSSQAFEISDSNKEAVKRVLQVSMEEYLRDESRGLPKEIVQDIKSLWIDPAIQATYARSSEYQLSDSTEYFFSILDKVAQENYVPTQEDILRVRVKTTGINEIEFAIGRYQFSMTDVGGQRSERRKWIHCFEDVTAIIFCAALSEYDQKLYEDQTTNRMFEALRLFSDITNSRWFNETPIILFLNKKDIFEKKITKVPLNTCFKNYTGPNQPEEAAQYIEKQFLAQIKNPNKLIYTYKTCATDTNNVRFVFKAVKDIFITAYLNQLGLGIGAPVSPPPQKQRTPTANNLEIAKQRQATT